jgi:DNA mismatch endonuclease (patch repair protein)
MIRTKMMPWIGSNGTAPELLLRLVVHAAAFLDRRHSNDLPERPDIALPRNTAIIMVHGCLWHDKAESKNIRIPKTIARLWASRLARDTERKKAEVQQSRDLRWRVLTVVEWIRGLSNTGKLFSSSSRRSKS